jgi:hypothetical protein
MNSRGRAADSTAQQTLTVCGFAHRGLSYTQNNYGYHGNKRASLCKSLAHFRPHFQ